MAANTQNINAKSVAKYILLPGIVPRAKELGSSGFGYLAFLFALVYSSVRILPPNHPYLRAENIGTFSIRQVIATAANNIQFNRKNIDQIVVFITILTAVVLMFLQAILFILGIFSSQAFAGAGGGGPFLGIFETQYPEVDIAFLMLDYVFGIPDLAAGGATSFFGSNALQATGGPTPFQQGMHAMFNFYNLAILLVGVLIFMYYVIVVVIETAETGVPFGRRFSKLYAPFRLIFAVGALVPFGYGFNGAQYITLYAAKIGSSFATNAWLVYNDAMAAGGTGAASTNNPMGAPNQSLVARPRTPPSDELFYFGSVYHACREMYSIWSPANYQNPQEGTCIMAYVIVNGQAQLFVDPGGNGAACPAGPPAGNYTMDQAITDFGRSDIEIVLGELNTEQHIQYAGNVRPYCGSLSVSLNFDNPPYYNGAGGIRAIQQSYWNMLQGILQNDNAFAQFGERAAHSFVPTCSGGGAGCTHDTCFNSGPLNDGATCGDKWTPGAPVFQQPLTLGRTNLNDQITGAYNDFANGIDLALDDETRRRGWGGAGIWYNHIADLNGTFTGAVYATPSVRKYPEIMEFVKSQRQAQDKSTAACDTFDPNLGDNKRVEFTNTSSPPVAEALNGAYKYFNCEKPNQETGAAAVDPGAAGQNPQAAGGNNCDGNGVLQGSTTRGVTSNAVIDVISIVFGLNGLFDIRCNSQVDPNTGEARVHPLAQLSAVGKSLVENSIRSMAVALGASFGGGMAGVLGSALGPAMEAVSGMFVGIATIGLTAGFVLYYILPFLPFIYFFFAVGSWVKSIFEAMVGAPLWALAHLRIDGEGLPGRAAMGGYFLIFEIFLRPIVTVFGLVGGIAIFGAQASMLNNIFDLVVTNVSGAAPGAAGAVLLEGTIESFRRGIIDQFFFTIMYTILLYMMATASFKMIDMVPKQIMRWINTTVSTFNDNKQDPTANLTQYVAVGGSQVTQQLFGGLRSGVTGLGQGLGSVIKEATGTGKPKQQ